MSNSKYRKILEELLRILDIGVYIVDEKGIGIFYNEAMSNIEKIDANYVIGKEFHKAFPGIRLTDSTMYQALKKNISTRNKQQNYKNLYGKDITTVNTTVPVLDNGKTIAAVEVARDITSIKYMSDKIITLLGEKNDGTDVEDLSITHNFSELVGESPAYCAAVEKAKIASKNNAPVVICGEIGTGKDTFSESIHNASNRKDRPYLFQNCGEFPEALVEGILFGTVEHEGSGTIDRPGLFEQAAGGTLVLDEISALSMEMQSKLLGVLRNGKIKRVGGNQEIPIDARIIATVNEAPELLIEEGRLKKDLYYRLNVVEIYIPPLRNRKADIPILAENLLNRHNEKMEKEVWMISEQAIRELMDYNYPGNVRELENIIIQAITVAGNSHVLSEKHLQMPMQAEAVERVLPKWDRKVPIDEYMAAIERDIIRSVLIDERGNVSKTAEILSLKRQTLQHKIKKYGIK